MGEGSEPGGYQRRNWIRGKCAVAFFFTFIEASLSSVPCELWIGGENRFPMYQFSAKLNRTR